MKGIPVFVSWAGVALVTLLSIINLVRAPVILRSINSHLSQEERNCQVIRACIDRAGIRVAVILPAHLIMIVFGIVIPGMGFTGGMVIWRFEHLQQGPRLQKPGGK